MFKFRDEGSNVFRFYKTGIGGIIIGKVSVQLHTIVKQISFPNVNVLFLSLFLSLFSLAVRKFYLIILLKLQVTQPQRQTGLINDA